MVKIFGEFYQIWIDCQNKSLKDFFLKRRVKTFAFHVDCNRSPVDSIGASIYPTKFMREFITY